MFFKHTTPADAPIMARAVISTCRSNGWLSDIQPQFLRTVFHNLMSYNCDFLTLEPISVDEFALAIPEPGKRNEVLDLMLATELLCGSISPEIADLINLWAQKLGIENNGLTLIRDLSKKSVAQAQQDFYRSNYFYDEDLATPGFAELDDKYGLSATMMTIESSDEVAERYENLQNLPAGTLGRALWDFYKKRGFFFPGVIGSVNEAVAHHDWIHVLADYDSDGIGEIEVAAFSSMATESESAVMNFLGTLSIFQGGLLKTIVAGAPHLGHEMEVVNGPERISIALQRGKEVNIDLVVGINYFDYAHERLEELQTRWNILPRTV
jgi:hypothetical protein